VIGRAPAVIIHGAEDGRRALALDLPVTLCSAPGAALYAGAGWWCAMMALLRAERPARAFEDILDCGDVPGRAAEALRAGQRLLVLDGAAPAMADRVRRMALECGATVLAAMPPALDLAQRGALRRLPAWLAAG
jgi:hypothetical protein